MAECVGVNASRVTTAAIFDEDVVSPSQSTSFGKKRNVRSYDKDSLSECHASQRLGLSRLQLNDQSPTSIQSDVIPLETGDEMTSTVPVASREKDQCKAAVQESGESLLIQFIFFPFPK